MNLHEKIELIQSSSSESILKGGFHNGTPLLKYIFEIHEEVFGMPCKSCADALPGYIKKVQSINLKENIMSKADREYRMKSGSVINVKGTNKYYSDLNITDEIAKELLKENPNRSALFAKMPKAEAKATQSKEDKGILGGNVSQVAEALKAVETVEELDVLLEEEKAGGDRKGVYAAIEARRNEITEAAE